MNPRLKALLDTQQAQIDRLTELRGMDSHDETQTAEYEKLPGAIEQTEASIRRENNADAALRQGEAFLNGRNTNLSSMAAQAPEIAAGGDAPDETLKRLKLSRAGARYFATVTPDKEQARKKAYDFGMFLRASLGNKPNAIKYCQNQGIPISTGQSEGVNEDGGFLVPPQFEADMIDLREIFGIFRQFARNSPMIGDTKSRPGRKSGLTAYFKGESEAAAESKKGWYEVTLNAQKLMVLTRYTNELGEDAVVNMGDDLAGEISYAFAKKEDQCGFIGDGSSTYGKMVGVGPKLTSTYTSATVNSNGVVIASGNAYSEVTLGDFQTVVGLLPEYAETPNVAWYCSKVFWEATMVRLMLAAGGVPAAEIVAGLRRQFMGYPVRVSQVMPKVAANSQLACFLGDLRLAADFGDRRATTIAMSEHAEFDTDEIAIRGTERFDINVHGIGISADGDPIVGLRMLNA